MKQHIIQFLIVSLSLLVALTAATELGYNVSAFEVIPCLFYPFALLISSLLFMFLGKEKNA